jgi:hypothetical protein
MDFLSIILVCVIIYFVIRFLGLDKKDNLEPFESESAVDKKQKLIDEAWNKKNKFYEKLQSDYKKWELMTDSKEKEKLWSQLVTQQELWDKLDGLRSDEPDFFKKVNSYLKK